MAAASLLAEPEYLGEELCGRLAGGGRHGDGPHPCR
jgi:hypothetical protein